MHSVSLQSVLVLLASAVIAVAACRRLRLPPIVGYLITGLALGPHALGLVGNQ
jgi:monovalent cation:H+ antiporter-2, CPA2 family